MNLKETLQALLDGKKIIKQTIDPREKNQWISLDDNTLRWYDGDRLYLNTDYLGSGFEIYKEPVTFIQAMGHVLKHRFNSAKHSSGFKLHISKYGGLVMSHSDGCCASFVDAELLESTDWELR